MNRLLSSNLILKGAFFGFLIVDESIQSKPGGSKARASLKLALELYNTLDSGLLQFNCMSIEVSFVLFNRSEN